MKKTLLLLIGVFLLLSLGGCSSMLKKDYASITPYDDDNLEQLPAGTQIVSDYNSLKTLLSKQISNHSDHEKLRFVSYEGDIDTDLRRASEEVKTLSGMEAYAVDYISFDLNRIVSYSEADIYVSYRRTKEQIQEIVPIFSNYLLRNHLHSLMSGFKEESVIRIASSPSITETISTYIDELFLEMPLTAISKPKVNMTIYSGTSRVDIIELELSYGMTKDELIQQSEAIIEQVSVELININAGFRGETSETIALEAMRAISGSIQYDAGDERAQNWSGHTAYGAFVKKEASSLGFALAYKALCDKLSIENLIISGRSDRRDHYWNIIKLGDNYYHVDVSMANTLGEELCFLRTDEQMFDRYDWDDRKYPSCVGEASLLN
ncbi:hypothetical protein LJC01_03155 [Clostridiaceae bacterium OttesenSCG-928-D20]|nr:hypothetical protein [Clostridiaceae bacterium OttesenSCG-928-D20]